MLVQFSIPRPNVRLKPCGLLHLPGQQSRQDAGKPCQLYEPFPSPCDPGKWWLLRGYLCLKCVCVCARAPRLLWKWSEMLRGSVQVSLHVPSAPLRTCERHSAEERKEGGWTRMGISVFWKKKKHVSECVCVALGIECRVSPMLGKYSAPELSTFHPNKNQIFM